MKMLQRGIRTFWLLTISSGLLGVTTAGHAQGVTINPTTLEAYQPFTIEYSISCPLPGNNDVDVYVRSDAVVVETRHLDPGFVCPVVDQTAVIAGLSGGTYPLKFRGRDWNSSGELGPEGPAVVTIAIAPAPPTQPVFAFYNERIKHYFITASTAEKNSLLGGGGGGSWAIVDEGFRAWPADGPAPAAAKPVCRFYSAAVNSHFYTAGTGECAALKQPTSGWAYEGVTFRALVPTKNSCYPGTTPVWRLYNDRFAQSDSNHRFVASEDTYRHMIASGWVGEGVAFCSPGS